jgi:hypothetical protein
MRHLLFVYVFYNYLKYNGLSYLRVFAQYESYTLFHADPGQMRTHQAVCLI